jgi:hypothetical protein
VIDAQRLPLFFAEEDGAGHLGGLASELREMENAPGDHQVDAEARLEAVGLAQTPVFDAAPAFQGSI